MAIEHAVLGLLAIKPRHGYELAKEFASDTVLGDIVHLEPGMLYAHLKKLEREGWVRSRLEPQESRPPRRVFEMTDAGREELQRWMAEPVEKTRDIRLEFLLKLYLAKDTDPALARQLIRNQREICRQLIASLEEQIDASDDPFHVLVLDMRLAQNRALAHWLDRIGSLDLAVGAREEA